MALLVTTQISTISALAATARRPLQTIETTPVVICPGFGNDQIDYDRPLQQPREAGMIAALERRGFPPDNIFVVPVQRKDWLRVAGGLLDWKFYTNEAVPTGGGYGWYITRFRDTVDRAFDECNANSSNSNSGTTTTSSSSRVLVIGHSAGGWLARAGLGDGVWCAESNVRTADRICGLVTVGAIHKPPKSVAACVTRGALAYTDSSYPGAFLRDEGIGYVSVGGDAIVGDNTKKGDLDVSEADDVYATRGEGSASRVAYNSYEAVCGVGNVSGDGVVPLSWTQLEGSKQIQLEGVFHSINEAGTTIPTDRWYGSEKVIDRWLPIALEEAGISSKTVSSNKKNAFDMEGLQKWAAGIFQMQ